MAESQSDRNDRQDVRNDRQDLQDLQHLQDAIQEGERRATVAATLKAHEGRLDAINGSIRRSADQTERLNRKIDDLSEQIAAIAHEQSTKQAVSIALRKEELKKAAATKEELERANNQQISRRDLVVAVLTLMLMLAGIFVALH